jgi:hypothetical protein
MNKIRPANMSDNPSKRKVMSIPKDGTHVQCSITGTPLNTAGACDNNKPRLAAVMAPATEALNKRRWAPLTAVSTLPNTKGKRTTSNSTGTPKNLHGFYGQYASLLK